jgi:hypothetical protein
MPLTSERAREIQALRTVRRGGRPSKRETVIRAALEAGLPTSEVIEALRQAVLDGKSWAIALWLAYCWGRPGDVSQEHDDEAWSDPAELSDAELAGIAKGAVTNTKETEADYE